MRTATSAPILVEGGDVGEGAADVDPDTQFHEAALFGLGPQFCGRGGIDAEVVLEGDAVIFARRLARDIAAHDVFTHALRRAFARIAPAAAAGEFHGQHVVLLQPQSGDFGGERPAPLRRPI